jgi:hypothetical protein
MKNKITITVFICLLGIGCKSIKVTDLKVKEPNALLLPALEPQINLTSFETAYSLGTTKSSGTSAGIGQGLGGGTIVGVGVSSSVSTAVKDKRVQDALIIYEREIRENITNGNEKPKGYSICKITTGQTKLGSAGWIILSGVTLGVPNILGMPYGSYKTELEVEIEIQDSCKNTIGRYTGYGYNKTLLAAYWGYGGGSAHITGNESGARKSNILAFKMAMQEVKNKINADNVRLAKALENCKR